MTLQGETQGERNPMAKVAYKKRKNIRGGYKKQGRAIRSVEGEHNSREKKTRNE